MLGGILFVFIVWFLPILVWYFIQGRKEFNALPGCEAQSKEQKNSKLAFYGALGFGLIVILLIIIFG